MPEGMCYSHIEIKQIPSTNGENTVIEKFVKTSSDFDPKFVFVLFQHYCYFAISTNYTHFDKMCP